MPQFNLKYKLISLGLVIGLIFTSTANAGEFNSAKFAQTYPNIAKSVEVYAYAAKTTTQKLALSGFGYSYFNPDDIEKRPQQVMQKLEQCSTGFDSPAFPLAMEKYLATNFSSEELQQIEDYFASSAGQKQIAYTKRSAQHFDLKLALAGKQPDEIPLTEFEYQNGKDGEKMSDFALSKIGQKYRNAIFNDKDPDINKPMNEMDACLEKAKVDDYVKL